MSDTPQGPGWWQASDGKWYPPEQSPGATPTPAGGGGGATLDTGAAISYGWNKFVQYIGQIIIIVLIIFAVTVIFNWVLPTVVLGTVDNGVLGAALRFLVWAAGIFIMFLLQAGLIRVALAVTRGQAPDPSMLFSTDHLGPFIIGAILVSILTFLGFFVCCVGALVVMFFTLFWGYYVIDRGVSGPEGIKASYEIIKSNASGVLVFAIVVIVLNLITCNLALGVTSIAMAYAYKTLNGEAVAA